MSRNKSIHFRYGRKSLQMWLYPNIVASNIALEYTCIYIYYNIIRFIYANASSHLFCHQTPIVPQLWQQLSPQTILHPLMLLRKPPCDLPHMGGCHIDCPRFAADFATASCLPPLPQVSATTSVKNMKPYLLDCNYIDHLHIQLHTL